MAVFVIDEDMNRSVAAILQALGHTVFDVRDHGLRSKSDDEIYAFAQARNAVILTADLDFASMVRFPLGTHRGIVVARYPNEMPTNFINVEIEKALKDFADHDFIGALVVLSPGKVRIQRPRS